MEIFQVEYKGEKILVQKSERGSIYAILPTRYGDRGSAFRETITHEERGWRFTSTQENDIEYYFHMWLRDDGRIAWANDLTYSIQEFNEPFNPNYPNAGVLNDTALQLYSIVSQIKAYQKRNIPATELLLLRQYYLNTALKTLGYDSIDAVINNENNPGGVLGLNRIGCILEEYTDLSNLVFSMGEITGEETVVCIAPESVDRKKALELGIPVKNQIQDNIQFMQDESGRLIDKRSILPGYRTEMEKGMGVYTYDNYKNVVRDTAMLLLELNVDLLTEEQRKELELPELKTMDEMTLRDRISRLIDSKDFNNACKAENEFAYAQAEELIKVAKELIDSGKAYEFTTLSTPSLIRMVNEERTISADRKKALDNNERYNPKNKKRQKGYSLDDE